MTGQKALGRYQDHEGQMEDRRTVRLPGDLRPRSRDALEARRSRGQNHTQTLHGHRLAA
jgi:hypothetical protein